MRPKVILQLYPMLPAEGEDGRKRQRPLGRDSDLYHRVVHDWLDIIKAAEKIGVWGSRRLSITCIPKDTNSGLIRACLTPGGRDRPGAFTSARFAM
jgi:hypothetical protein